MYDAIDKDGMRVICLGTGTVETPFGLFIDYNDGFDSAPYPFAVARHSSKSFILISMIVGGPFLCQLILTRKDIPVNNSDMG